MLLIIFVYSIYYYTSVNFCKKILFFTMRRESQCMVERHCTFFSHDFSLHSKTNILIVRAAQTQRKTGWIKRRNGIRRRRREKCGSDIYVRRFRRDRPEENLRRFYFPSLECPSLSPSFVCISSAAIHSRRLSRTTEAPSQLRSECNHLGCRDSMRIQIRLARFSFRSAYVSDFILIMAP